MCGVSPLWAFMHLVLVCASQFEMEKVENQVLLTHHGSSEKGLSRHHDRMPIAKPLKSHRASVGLNSTFSFA